jgi:hypothetical protein
MGTSGVLMFRGHHCSGSGVYCTKAKNRLITPLLGTPGPRISSGHTSRISSGMASRVAASTVVPFTVTIMTGKSCCGGDIKNQTEIGHAHDVCLL